jgi:acyl dehydratase
MSEMCGSFPLYFGVMAFAGTVTTRFVTPVPVGERLIGKATLDRRERRKWFVDVTLTSSTGTELATASGIAIEMQAS